MVRTSLEDISDEEFDNIVLPFDDEINRYIDKNIVSNFIAYYIATGYNMSAIWNSSLRHHCKSAVDCLNDINNFNYNEIKEILENEYNLKVVNDELLEIEEIGKK